MKNLKRALSFALASVMLIGMMVVGAGAVDFGDAEKIEHTDAVNTLVALNVINGKDDGNYDPEGIVTRAEMAKLITVALNGGKDPVLGTKATPTYTDIKGHWAEAYIEYCSNLSIISGRGDGTFDPNGTVTGNEAAKMMLVAMGWDSTIFNFTGANWALNVGVEANKVKLFDDLEDINPSDGLTRDDTAQLIYNGILADTMEKSPNMSITNGEITWDYSLVNKSIFTEKFSGKVWIGTMRGNDKTIGALDEGSIRVYGKLEDAEDVASSYDNGDFPSDFDIANIGEEVKVLFKDGTAGKKNVPDKKDTIYGVFSTGASDVVSDILANVKDNKEAKARVNINGTKYDLADEVTVVTNYCVDEGVAYNDDTTGKHITGTASANSDLTNALKANNGDTLKAVTDSEGKIATIYVTTSKIAAVTGKNSEKVTLNNGVGTIKIADNEVYEDIAKGDVVVVTTLYDADATSEDAYSIVTKAEVVSGEVSGFKANTSNTSENVKLDGTTYKVYNKAAMLNAIPDETVTTYFDNDDIGETFDLYMVNGYVGAAIQVSESASNYSLVIAKNGGQPGTTFNGMEIQILTADGTKTILKVNDDSVDATGTTDVALTNALINVGDIITYTGSEDDATVTLEAKAASGSKTYNDNTKAFDGAVTTASAVLFAETTANAYTATSGTKFKAYSIRDLNSFTSANTTVVLNSDGKAVAVFADLNTTPAGATDTTVYGIVTAYNGSVKVDDDPYFEYTVASNGETYTIYVGSRVIAKGDLISFDPSSDNTYSTTDLHKITSGAVYVKEYNEADGTLTYYTAKAGAAGNWTGITDTQKTMALDDDCAIVYVNVDDDKAGADIGINAFDSVTGYKNVAIVTGMDGTEPVILAIFVETSNEEDILAVADTVGTTTDSEGVLKAGAALPANSTTIAPEAADVADATASINTVNGGLFNGYDTTATGISGKKLTTLTVTIPVEGNFAIRQTNAALAGAASDGRISGNVKVAGYANTSDTEIELSVLVLEGATSIKLEVISNVTGTYGNVFADNNTAFEAEEGAVVTYTIDTTGISFAE